MMLASFTGETISLAKKNFSKKSTFIELDVTRAIDIDTLQDWERALYYKKYLEAQRIKE